MPVFCCVAPISVSKRARVVEEILVHRNWKQRVQTVHDTLRRTNVELYEIEEAPETRRASHAEPFEVAPAYRFGERLRYQTDGADWTSVEDDARQEWERRYPGTWLRYREAIRAGWEGQ